MAKLKKKEVEELQKKLCIQRETVWSQATPAQRKEILALGERYKAFLDNGKTERLATLYIQEQAQKAGFCDIHQPDGKGRYYYNYRGKAIALVQMGTQPVSQGLRIVGSHIDCPRLDLKMHPLYEDNELVFLKTHYYGGIKKYQWLARPLAIHGVVCTAEGKRVRLDIGDQPDDPVFTLLDLLPHLSRKSQGAKKVDEAFEAERMNLLIGSLPIESDEGKDKVKLAILQLLHDTYGINEEDLISAELELVPAGNARDVGLDRSMVGGYAHDDRLCAYCSLEAALHLKKNVLPAVSIFMDKEEIGSEGATGAQSRFLEHLVLAMLQVAGEEPSYANVSRALAQSQSLSADVNAAYDPDFPEVHEKRNASFMGYGVSLTKYTGHGGKYGASDADAEFVAWVRGVWNQAGVTWQAAGLGKVDEGGGGTIAKHMAAYGMHVVDVGPPVLSMHSPFEICHKADIQSTVQAFDAFLKAPGMESWRD